MDYNDTREICINIQKFITVKVSTKRYLMRQGKTAWEVQGAVRYGGHSKLILITVETVIFLCVLVNRVTA